MAIWHTLRGGRFTRPNQGKCLFCILGLQLSVQDGPGNQASRARRRRPNNKLSGVEVRGGAQPPEPVGGAWGHRADSPTSGRYGNRPAVLRNVISLGNIVFVMSGATEVNGNHYTIRFLSSTMAVLQGHEQRFNLPVMSRPTAETSHRALNLASAMWASLRSPSPRKHLIEPNGQIHTSFISLLRLS